MKKTLKIEVQGATLITQKKHIPFQGDLKVLERPEYEAFREGLLKNGFSFTVHVWKHKGKCYIIDGHQRLFTVKKMEEEGYSIPLLPCSLVQAKSFKAAKIKVLAGVSNYGKMTEKSLSEFLKINDIPLDQIAATFVFPNIDITKVIESLGNFAPVPSLPEVAGSNGEGMRSAGDGVKQVQLFFDSEAHESFMKKIAVLSQHFKKTNITDTLVEVVNEAYRRTQKK